MHSQLRTIWLAVLGKNSHQGVKLPPRMHLVRQTLGHTVWVERATAVASLSVTILALCEGNAVRVFLLPVFKKQTAEQLCLYLPSYTCTSSARNFTTCLRQNVNIACCLGLQRCNRAGGTGPAAPVLAGPIFQAPTLHF